MRSITGFSNGNEQTRHVEKGRLARQFAALETAIRVDTVILGGGLTALTAAIQLTKSGRRVAVLAPGELDFSEPNSSEDELRTSTFSIIEPAGYANWFEKFGLTQGAQAAAAYRAAISELQEVASESTLADFTEVPMLTVAESVQELLAIERECAMGRALKGDCWFAREVPLPFRCSGASRDNSQAKLQLAPLLHAMALEFQRLGGEIFEYSSYVMPPVIGQECRVTTDNGSVTARNVIFAARAPHSLTPMQLGGLAPLHSYMISAFTDQPVGDAVFVLGENPRRMIWRADRNDPSRVIIRADYFGDQLESQLRRFDELCCYAASRLSIKRVESKWSYHQLVSTDGLPVAGRIPELENAYMALAMGASELPWGIHCGNLLADLVEGNAREVSALFDPERLGRRRAASSNSVQCAERMPKSRSSISHPIAKEASSTHPWTISESSPGGFQRSMDFGMNAPYLQATPEESERVRWQTRPR